MSSALSSRWVYCLDALVVGFNWAWGYIPIFIIMLIKPNVNGVGVLFTFGSLLELFFFLGCFRGKARITTHFEGFISHLSEGARHGPTFLDKLEPAHLGAKETHP